MVSLRNLSNSRGHSKLDIFRYMLASYSTIKWSAVHIYYSLDEEFKSKQSFIDDEINHLFQGSKLRINHFRIDDLGGWKSALKIINSQDDEWIWFSCNDDHIFIDSNLDTLKSILISAEKLSKTYKFISILPSHWQEYMAQRERNRIMNSTKSKLINDFGAGEIMLESENFDVSTFRTTGAIQIVNKNLINYWFSVEKSLPADLRRTDNITNFPAGQVTLIPHREICRHFDAYTHSNLPLSVIPVMFIPEGFFSNQIKIQYGFNNRKKGFTWIHPLKEMYENECMAINRTSNQKVDMNILLEDIPLFWKKRITLIESEIIDGKKLRFAYILQKLKELCADPRLGYFPKRAAIFHLHSVFKKKYQDISRAELMLAASRTLNLRDYFLRIHYLLHFLFYSEIVLFKIVGKIYYINNCIALLFSVNFYLELVQKKEKILNIIKTPKNFLNFIRTRSPRF